jgi:hypothetical protein
MQTITASGSQNYCVTITDVNGCTGTACQLVTVYSIPAPNITASGATTFCAGGSVTLNAGSFSSYNWSTGATTEIITATTTGNYFVTVSNFNGCTATAMQAVTVNAAPNATIAGSFTICNNGVISLSVAASASYHWSTGATSQAINTSSAGNYLVTVTNSSNCSASSSHVVTVSTFLAPAINASGATHFCSGGSVILDLSSSYSSYNWSNGSTTSTITVSTTGSYTVAVSNGVGCTGTAMKNVNVYALPVPTINVTGLATFCGGGNATLTVSGTYSSYHWNTGATTSSITTNTSGTYSVTVTNTNGCMGTASITISNTCTTPMGLSTTNIATTTSKINWVQPSCVYGYSIRRSLHNANNWTTFVISANTHYTFSGLIHNTTYDWQIRTNCNATQTSISNWSTTQTFTTLARLEDGDGITNPAQHFNVYPNPANDEVTVVFSSDMEENYNIRLIDITGRIVLNQNNTSVVGENQYQMNLSEIAKGIYMVILQKGDAIMQTKIVVQ